MNHTRLTESNVNLSIPLVSMTHLIFFLSYWYFEIREKHEIFKSVDTIEIFTQASFLVSKTVNSHNFVIVVSKRKEYVWDSTHHIFA
jgi:hypothetical protein